MLYFSLVGSKVEVIFCFHGLVELLRTSSFKVGCPEPLFFSSHDHRNFIFLIWMPMNVMHFIKASSFNFQGQGYENHNFRFIQRTFEYAPPLVQILFSRDTDLMIEITTNK
jgi:hypothetical protein